MSPLKDLPQFKEYMVTLGQNPILGVFAGAVITVLIQASSATIGILQGLYAGGFVLTYFFGVDDDRIEDIYGE